MSEELESFEFDHRVQDQVSFKKGKIKEKSRQNDFDSFFSGDSNAR